MRCENNVIACTRVHTCFNLPILQPADTVELDTKSGSINNGISFFLCRLRTYSRYRSVLRKITSLYACNKKITSL